MCGRDLTLLTEVDQIDDRLRRQQLIFIDVSVVEKGAGVVGVSFRRDA